MWRVLRAGVMVAVIALAAAWLANAPGQVVVWWRGYELQTSVVFILLAGVAAGIGIAVVWRGLWWVYKSPRRLRDRLESRRAHRDGMVLNRAIAALDAGDPVALRRQQARLSAGMRRLLGDRLTAAATRLEGERLEEEREAREARRKEKNSAATSPLHSSGPADRRSLRSPVQPDDPGLG